MCLLFFSFKFTEKQRVRSGRPQHSTKHTETKQAPPPPPFPTEHHPYLSNWKWELAELWMLWQTPYWPTIIKRTGQYGPILLQNSPAKLLPIMDERRITQYYMVHLISMVETFIKWTQYTYEQYTKESGTKHCIWLANKLYSHSFDLKSQAFSRAFQSSS